MAMNEPKSDNYQHLLDKAWKINQEHYGGKSEYWNGYSQAVWDLKEMDVSSKLQMVDGEPVREGSLEDKK